MTLKNLDDIQKFQKDCQKEMKEKIEKFDERNEEYWNEVMETVHGPDEEE